ncbi:MAG: class I SAM-dependent methyltransferase [Ktedonobacterales bacterium]
MNDYEHLDQENLEEFRDPDTYDLLDAGYMDDRAVIEQWAQSLGGPLGGPLLDLACGTGRMAIPMALRGYDMTAVDIVPEMVEWGRQKATRQGAVIEWVVADARTFHLQQQFSFIFMLCNAWQFFLTRADQEALLASVREHLRMEGCFLFETRNPNPHNLLELRNPEPQHFTTSAGERLVTTQEQYYDPMTQIQHYTYYHCLTGQDGQSREKTKHTALRYVYPQEMEALLHYNGFRIRACYGDWEQAPLTADSPAMIYVCERDG